MSSSATPPSPISQKPLPFPALAALLSFAMPGLGQIAQGFRAKNFARMSKGCFFLLALWGMFFFGFARSHWRNVYLPHVQEVFIEDDQRAGRLNKSLAPFGKPAPALVGNLWQRPQYTMQFFAGAPAWPALWNYCFPDMPVFGKYQESPGSLKQQDNNNGLNEASRRESHSKAMEAIDNEIQLQENMGRLWDIYWIYTVVAGALNLVVVYDAYAGPVKYRPVQKKVGKGAKK
jgi:hypothetical protein